jgi:hypothetical protein
MWQIASNRLPFAFGATVDADMLGNVNIEALVKAGHLVAASKTSNKKNLKAEPIKETVVVEPGLQDVESDGDDIPLEDKEY